MNLAPEKVEKLEARVRHSPGAPAFARLADYYRVSGNVDKAINLCENGIRHNPTYATGHLLLGRCYYEKARIEEAAREFKTVLQIDCKNIFALKILGDISAQGGRREEAAGYYKVAADFDPFNPYIREVFRQFERFYKEDGQLPIATEKEAAAEQEPEVAAPAEAAAPAPAASAASSETTAPATAAGVPEAPPAETVVPGALDTAWQEHAPAGPPSPPDAGAESPAPAPGQAVPEAPPSPDAKEGAAAMTDIPSAAVQAETDIHTEMVDLPMEMQEVQEEAPEVLDEKPDVPSVPPPAADGTDGAARPPSAEPAPGPAGVAWLEADEDLKQLVESVQTAEISPKPPPVPGVSRPGPGIDGRAAPPPAKEEAAVAPARPAEAPVPPAPPSPASTGSADRTGSAASGSDSLGVELGNDVELAIPSPEVKSREKEPPEDAAAEEDAVPAPAEDEKTKTRVISNVATYKLADIYLRQGYRDQALAVYRKMLAKKPGDEKIKAKIQKLEEEIGRSYGGKKEGKKRNG